jgi:hypothetical protein
MIFYDILELKHIQEHCYHNKRNLPESFNVIYEQLFALRNIYDRSYTSYG